MENFNYKPIKYFLITLLFTGISGFAAIYFSQNEELYDYHILALLPGLFMPFIVAMFMIFGSRNKDLMKDFLRRVFDLRITKMRYWVISLLIVGLTLLVATAISLLFGQSVDQFKLSEEFTSGEFLGVLIILMLAPTFEELGWRGYGVDSLKPKRSIMKATLIFAVLWNIWHLPLFFIKDYYQFEILHQSPLFALNFIVSLIPAAILMAWLYYKNNRSITIVIYFHFLLNFFAVVLQTEQITKSIVTLILIVITAVIVMRDKEFFFKK